MRYLYVLFTLVLSVSAYAQDISQTDLERMRGLTETKEFKVRQNATTNNSIGDLSTVHADREAARDMEFTHIIKRGPVTNQQRSGRCWIFAGLNVLRYDTAEALNVPNFEFSENYLFFYHKLELANYMFESTMTSTRLNSYGMAWQLRHGLSDGGYWGMFVHLVDKYGVVPRSAMPETLHSINTREFNDLFDRLVKKHVANLWAIKGQNHLMAKDIYKQKAMDEVYQFLALTLGTPPTEFGWRYTDKNSKLHPSQTYTPQTFANKYVIKRILSRVHLMHDPSLDQYKRFSLDGIKNATEAPEETFLNVPMEVLLTATKKSVLANRPVWFGADVMKFADISGGALDTGTFDYAGTLGFTVDSHRADRLRTYASAPTHAMVFFGVDLAPGTGAPVKWLVENSWGASSGDGGYLRMTTEWFSEYVFDVVVDREFVESKVVKAMDGPITVLPSWHHLWKE